MNYFETMAQTSAKINNNDCKGNAIGRRRCQYQNKLFASGTMFWISCFVVRQITTAAFVLEGRSSRSYYLSSRPKTNQLQIPSPEHRKRNLQREGIRQNAGLCLAGGYRADDVDRDPVLRLPLLEAELATRKECRASEQQTGDGTDTDGSGGSLSDDELKTAIQDAKSAAELGVRRSQIQFYDAFSEMDWAAMCNVWSKEPSAVRCVHPGMEAVEGRDAVLESWKQILDGPGAGFSIEPDRVKIEICGLVAICSCIEKTPGGGKMEALNVYKRENGSWRMTLHHAGPVMISL